MVARALRVPYRQPQANTSGYRSPMSEESTSVESPARAGFLAFLWRTKLFWLPPILLALLSLLALYFLAGGNDVVAPFVYDL